MPISNDKAILKHKPPDFFQYRFGNFGNEGPAKTVADQSKIRERFSANKVHDGLHALRMPDFLFRPFSVTNRRGSERLVSLRFEVANDPFPRGSVMPGTMHQKEHCHCCLSQERSDAYADWRFESQVGRNRG